MTDVFKAIIATHELEFVTLFNGLTQRPYHAKFDSEDTSGCLTVATVFSGIKRFFILNR
jgi:hypothetical protein